MPESKETRSRVAKLSWQNPEHRLNHCLYPRSNATSFITHNRYDPDTGCWNWTGGKSTFGYGSKRYMGKNEHVHRLSAHFYLGYDLNSDLCVLHSCDNPMCFNPKHLFIGTKKDNSKDMASKGRNPTVFRKRTHCLRGHELTLENSYFRKDSRRQCLACTKFRSSQEYKGGVQSQVTQPNA